MNHQQHALDASSALPGEPEPRKTTIQLDDQTVATLKLKDSKTDKIWFDDKLIGFGIRLRSDGGRACAELGSHSIVQKAAPDA